MKRLLSLGIILGVIVAMLGTPLHADSLDVEKVMEIKNDHGELSHGSFIQGDTAYYSIWGAIHSSDAESLWSDISILEGRGIKKLNIYINSPGGNGFAGMAMTDTLRMAKDNGFDVKTYATGMCASAAVPIFLAGGERITSKNTIFMIHEGMLFKRYASETLKDLDAQREMMKMSGNQYVNWLVERTNLTKPEVEKYISETTWFSADQAKAWGFADTVK